MSAWTNHEMKRLSLLYPKLTENDLLLAFAPRSIKSIQHMAKRMGLRKYRDWKAIAAAYTPMIFSVPNRVSELVSGTPDERA